MAANYGNYAFCADNPVALSNVVSPVNGVDASSILTNYGSAQTFYTSCKDAGASSGNHYQIISYLAPPSTPIVAVDIAPSGAVSIPQLAINDTLVVNSSGAGHAAAIQLDAVDASNQQYRLSAANSTSGGLSDGHFNLYSYNNSSTPVAQVLDYSPQTNSNATGIMSVLPPTAFYSSVSLIGQTKGQFTMVGSASQDIACPSIAAGDTVILTCSVPVGGGSGTSNVWRIRPNIGFSVVSRFADSSDGSTYNWLLIKSS
jgi:hypothetical protein